MQKQLKLIDQQLNKNGLIRIQDPQMKAQNSLFRAISMAVFYNHSEYQKVISYMKLCLLSSSQLHSSLNPMPVVPSRSRYLLKFKCSQNKQLLSDYLNNPDMACFQKENLQIASVVFDRKVQLYIMDQNQYLSQNIISLGKNSNPKNHRKFKTIMLTKISNRYYCVMTQQHHKLINFLKQYIGNQIIANLSSSGNTLQRSNSMNSSSIGSKQGKVHFPSFDDNHSRQHKKSLSDCGDRDVSQPNINLNNKNLVNPNLSKHFDVQEQTGDQQNFPNLPTLQHTQSYQDPGYYHHLDYNNYIIHENPYQYYRNHDDMDYYQNNHNSLTKSMQFSPSPGLYKTNSMMNSMNSNSPNSQQHCSQYYQSGSPNTTAFQHDHNNNNGMIMPMKNNRRYTGRLKFFDQNKNYGFIVVDNINQDLFVHFDDLSKAGIPKDSLKSNVEMRFEFTCLEYDGKNKNKKSKKAVDLVLISDYSLL